jgi:hypothetical protein
MLPLAYRLTTSVPLRFVVGEVRRMRKKLRGASALVASLLLVGCAPGKRPFLIVQMCLSDKQGVSEFVDEMRSIASEEKLEFVDNSSNTEHELKDVGYAGRERAGGSGVINVIVLRKDGMAIGAGNLGLPGYQVAAGFSEGSNVEEARDFSNRVLTRFRKHWRIEVVPAGTGAKPMPGCK